MTAEWLLKFPLIYFQFPVIFYAPISPEVIWEWTYLLFWGQLMVNTGWLGNNEFITG